MPPRLAEVSLFARGKNLTVLTDEGLFEACGTRIAFTTRSGGVSEAPYAELNLSCDVGDAFDFVSENRRILCEALGAADDAANLVNPHQTHETGMQFICDASDLRRAHENSRENADGVVCTRAHIPVLLLTADCVPVILVAPAGSFAVVHAGWRGTIASIAEIGLKNLAKATSCLPSEINCYIGPHIGSCCYEVDSELLKRFVGKYGSACDAGNNRLDLSYAVFRSLVSAGAVPERIVDSGFCTSCRNDLFFSYRAEAGKTGRHGAFAYRKERR